METCGPTHPSLQVSRMSTLTVLSIARDLQLEYAHTEVIEILDAPHPTHIHTMESVCKETCRVIYTSILSNRQKKNEKNHILLRKFAKVQEFSYPLMVYTNGDECTATTQTGYQKTDAGC